MSKIAPDRKAPPRKGSAGRRRSGRNPQGKMAKVASAWKKIQSAVLRAFPKPVERRPGRQRVLVSDTNKIVTRTKPKRFWVLGVLAILLFYHSYGILSGIYGDLNIVSYDQAIALGVIEALIFPVLTIIFLWKTVAWWHDRPYTQKHVFDDQNILD